MKTLLVMLMLSTTAIGMGEDIKVNDPNEYDDGIFLLNDIESRFGLTYDRVDKEISRAYIINGIFRNEVKSWNNEDVFYIWENETYWRINCWRQLKSILSPEWPSRNDTNYTSQEDGTYIATTRRRSELEIRAMKLEAIRELKKLIGEEAFIRGDLPYVIPYYKR